MFSISDIRNDKPTIVVSFVIACLNRNRVVELCEGWRHRQFKSRKSANSMRTCYYGTVLNIKEVSSSTRPM